MLSRHRLRERERLSTKAKQLVSCAVVEFDTKLPELSRDGTRITLRGVGVRDKVQKFIRSFHCLRERS